MHPMNFGELIYNDVYKIFRSAELGSLGLHQLKKTLDQQGKEFPRTIIYMNAEGYKFPLYYAIEEWKDQEEYGFKYFHPFGEVRTYVSGENPYEEKDVIDKDKYFGHEAKKYFTEGDGAPCGGVDAIVKVLELILDPRNSPILFHCLGGFHRTGMIAMCIRLMQDWDLPKIVEEYRQHNPLFFRQRNLNFVEKFSKSDEFAMLEGIYKGNSNSPGGVV